MKNRGVDIRMGRCTAAPAATREGLWKSFATLPDVQATPRKVEATLRRSRERCLDLRERCKSPELRCLRTRERCRSPEQRCLGTRERCRGLRERCRGTRRRSLRLPQRCPKLQERCRGARERLPTSSKRWRRASERFLKTPRRCLRLRERCGESVLRRADDRQLQSCGSEKAGEDGKRMRSSKQPTPVYSRCEVRMGPSEGGEQPPEAPGLVPGGEHDLWRPARRHSPGSGSLGVGAPIRNDGAVLRRTLTGGCAHG